MFRRLTNLIGFRNLINQFLCLLVCRGVIQFAIAHTFPHYDFSTIIKILIHLLGGVHAYSNVSFFQMIQLRDLLACNVIRVYLGSCELRNEEKRWALVRKKKCPFLIAGKGESQLLGW
jgi:hypothetical protein